MSRRLLIGTLLALSLLLTGCAPRQAAWQTCNVVFEDNEDLFFYRQVYPVTRGADLTVEIGVPTGYHVTQVSYDRYTLSGKTGWSKSYDYYTLILHEIRYPTVVRLSVGPAYVTVYHLETGDIAVQEDSPRRFPNARAYDASLEKEGFLAIGWRTETGELVGFGSQPLRTDGEALSLSPAYLPCSSETLFSWEAEGGGAVITGYHGAAKDLVIPERLGGLPVTRIRAGAFGDVRVDRAAFPSGLRVLEPGAFAALRARDVYLFDALETVSDAAFGALDVTHLHVNAARAPAYCGTYFDTFTEKMAYLRTLTGQKKLVLFCGSSARFGYDSPMLEEAFPAYHVANMGVYAYAGMLPQARLVEQFLESGDVVLLSPELDAIEEQFCVSRAMSREMFAMTEANYDLLSRLDCRAFTGIFDAFAAFQSARRELTPRDYADAPAWFDEDGARQAQPVYNRWGDYILYRENNLSGKNFGVKRADYTPDAVTQREIDALNGVIDAFASRGARVLLTYSPRSKNSVTPESTPHSAAALHALLRQSLHASVISNIEDSLMDPLYFYGTDNHLSTEGAKLRTLSVIADLRGYL